MLEGFQKLINLAWKIMLVFVVPLSHVLSGKQAVNLPESMILKLGQTCQCQNIDQIIVILLSSINQIISTFSDVYTISTSDLVSIFGSNCFFFSDLRSLAL